MADQVVQVDPQMLVQVLNKVRRTQPVGLIARTIPEMRRKQNPFYLGDGVFDLVRIRQATGFIGYGFQSVVNRQREREGRATDFRAQERSWGERPRLSASTEPKSKARSPLVRHRGTWYLSLKRQRIVRTEHRRITTNELVDEKELREFLRPDDGRHEKKRQRLDRPVIVRDYAIAHVAQLTLAGTLYLMTPCPHTALNHCATSSRGSSSAAAGTRRAQAGRRARRNNTGN